MSSLFQGAAELNVNVPRLVLILGVVLAIGALVVNIRLVVLACYGGVVGENVYGADPLEPAAAS